jgi:hypothetical protein
MVLVLVAHINGTRNPVLGLALPKKLINYGLKNQTSL